MISFPSRHPMISTILFATLCSTLLLVTGCEETGSTSQDISSHLKRSESYSQQGQFKAAIIEAKNAIQKAPESEEGHLLLTHLYLDMGQAKAALAQLEQLPNSSSPDYLFTKIQAYHKLSKFQSANKILLANQQALTSANELKYLEFSAKNQLGSAQLDQAGLTYKKLQQLDPDNSKALLGLARIAALKGDINLAEGYVSKIIENNPDNTSALVLKANIHRSQNNLAEAENALTIALTSLPTADIITPERANILTNLANILTQQGRSTEALIYTRILAEALPGQLEINNQFEKAMELLKEGKFDQAEQQLTEIVKEAPSHESAKQILGIIKYNQGDLKAANQYFSSSIDPEIAPESATMAYAMTNMRLNQPDKVLALLGDKTESSKNAQLLGLYGIAALSSDQPKKGEQAIKKALTLEPKRSRLRLPLASYYNNQNKSIQALEQLEQGYQSTPADPYIQKSLLSQYIVLKQKEKADQLVSQIEKNYSTNPSSLIIIASYQNLTDQQGKAVSTLREALAKNPSNSEALHMLGAILLNTGKFGEATDHYRNMIKIRHELPSGYKGLITALELQNKQQQAMVELQSIEKTSTSIIPSSVLIEYFARKQEFKKANDILARVQQKFIDDPLVNKLRTQLAYAESAKALQNNDTDTARNVLLNGLQASPENSQLQALLIETEIAANQYQEASKLIAQLAQFNSNLATLLKGDLATAENKPTVAISHYNSLWKTTPSNPLAKRIYQTYVRQENNVEAKNFLSTWAKRFPQSFDMLAVKSNMALRENRFDEAIVDLEKILKQQQKPSAALLNNLAWAYLKTGKLPEALANAEKAYSIAPRSPEIADTYGWILAKTGNIQEAKKMLNLALELAPENSEIIAHWNELNKQ